MNRRLAILLLVLTILAVVIVAVLVWSEQVGNRTAPGAAAPRTTFVIGSVSFDAADDIEEYQPIADYIVNQLQQFGYTKGKVVVTKSAAQMAQLMRRGEVDLYIDSPFPTFAVDQLAGSEPLLNRWKKGVEKYHAVVFVKKSSGIDTLDDLLGKMIIFDHPESTSGDFLPKASLLQQGYVLTEKRSLTDTVGPNEIGYFFANDDAALVNAVVAGTVPAGAQNESELIERLADANEQITDYTFLLTTPSVYRHVVTASKDLDPEVKRVIVDLLETMHTDPAGQALLKQFKKTKKFTPFEPTSAAAYKSIENLLPLVEQEIINR